MGTSHQSVIKKLVSFAIKAASSSKDPNEGKAYHL